MTLLNSFQSTIDLEVQYIFSLVLHSSFHHALECLVILTSLEYLFSRESDKDTFLYYFQQFYIRDIEHVNITYYHFNIIDESFFFFAVLNDSSSLILDKFILNNNVDS